MNNLSDTYSVYASDVQPDLNQLARELTHVATNVMITQKQTNILLSLLITKFHRVDKDQGPVPNRCLAVSFFQFNGRRRHMSLKI